MKKLYKKFVMLLTLIMLVTACAFSTGCADIKTLELKVRIYDYENSVALEGEDYVLTVDLYRHLAPKTVDAIIDLVEGGYYDNAIFYQRSGVSYDPSHSLKKILVGNLKYEDGKIVEQVAPEIEGEFERAGVVGNNLLNNKGYVGLMRSAYVSDGSYKTRSNAHNSGRGTMYLPVQEILDHDGHFCVFGKFDVEEENNKKVIDALMAVFDSETGNDYFDEFKVYYTGEYDKEKANQNYGLTFNYVQDSEFNDIKDDIANLFEAEKGNYIADYNPYKIYVPKVKEGKVGAQIVSANIR